MRALLALLVAVQLCAGEARPLRIYHIGNSLTMSLRLDRLHALLAERGIDYQFGSQLSGGKSLLRHLRYRSEPDQKWISWETNLEEGGRWLPGIQYNDPRPKRFGLHDQALVEHAWDVLVLQPFVSSLRDDLEACTAFIDLARRRNPQVRVLVYATWPKRARAGDGFALDYASAWTATYAFAADATDRNAAAGSASRDYYGKLRALLAERSGMPIGLVPGGETLFVLDQAIRAGRLPGLADLARRLPGHLPGWVAGGDPAALGANLLYADQIHLNPLPHEVPTLGVYAVALAMHGRLSGASPLGLSAAAYGFDPQADAALVRAVQELVAGVLEAP